MTSAPDYFSFQRGIADDGRLVIAAMPADGVCRIHLFIEGDDNTVTCSENSDGPLLTVMAPFELSPGYYIRYGYGMLVGKKLQRLANAIAYGAHQGGTWRVLDITDTILSLGADGIRALCNDVDLALGAGLPLPDGLAKDPQSGAYVATDGTDMNGEVYLSCLRDEIRAFFGQSVEMLQDRDVEIARRMIAPFRNRIVEPEQGPDLSAAPRLTLLVAHDMADDSSYRRVVAAYADETAATDHMEKANRFMSALGPLYNRDIPAISNPLDPDFPGGYTSYSLEAAPFIG